MFGGHYHKAIVSFENAITKAYQKILFNIVFKVIVENQGLLVIIQQKPKGKVNSSEFQELNPLKQVQKISYKAEEKSLKNFGKNFKKC